MRVDYFKADKNRINVFPNPAAEYLKFQSQDGVNISGFEVFDATGRKIDSNALNEGGINVSNYLQGIYFLRLNTDHGVFNCKFIKK